MPLAPILCIIQKVGVMDDHLILTPDEFDETLYNCEFKQHSTNSYTKFSLTTDTICAYLQLFFESMAEDSDGPDYVQFDIPTFPSTILRPADIPYMLPTVQRQIGFLQEQESWPLESNTNMVKPELGLSKRT